MLFASVFAVAGQAPAPTPAQNAEKLRRLIDACGTKPSNACKWVMQHTDNQALAKVADFLAGPVFQVILIWLVAWLVNRIVRRLIKRAANRIAGAAESGKMQNLRDKAPSVLVATGEIGLRSAARAQTTAAVLRSLASVVIYGFAVLYTANALGVKLGPLLAGAGVVGIAVGFGAQTLVKDFLSGMFMLVEDQYGVGDVIEVGQATGGASTITGTIEAVTLRTTRLRDLQGTVWHIPNGDIRRIGNKSKQWARAVVDLTVPLEADLATVEEIASAVASDVRARGAIGDEIIDAPEVWGLESVGPDGMVVRVVAKTRPGSQDDVARAIRVRCLEALREAGVAPARPERLVWTRYETPDSDGRARPRLRGGVGGERPRERGER